MLARAPGDIAHANVAQVTVPRRQRGSPRPAWGNGAVCPATPGANAHGVPRTAVTSANGAPSRPAGRVQPCRFDLLPPCTPTTARQRTRRSDWASRAARIGPLPGDQATVPPQDGDRRDPPVRPRHSRQEPDQRGQHRPAGSVPPGLVISGMARAHRAARTAASLRQGASASSYRHQRDRIVLRGIACHPAQPAAAHKAVLRAGSDHRSAALGDRWRPPARLCGKFVLGGQARGGSCGQHSESPRSATGKGGRALGDGPVGSARSRPG